MNSLIKAIASIYFIYYQISATRWMDVLEIYPSEEFEVTANPLLAHLKTHGKLILKPLIYLTANS